MQGFVPRDIETLLVSVPTRSILERASGRRGNARQWRFSGCVQESEGCTT
ncbi:hypothetical protein K788_0007354 (plasmid) [Paraburkholderia caribensis MBA4]|uniref:Uncharacterized protein n=1 Tax=Paraburkholderia caribensis MBA4 TaxID=1323664 RepID=A0A0N7JWC7_9BURK|nr:hypothetical protein K788_0007354 [Paraburkholderia caribensis MBA4]